MVEQHRAPTRRPPTFSLGEVHTGLLLNSTSVPSDLCTEILTLLRGQQTLRSERPIATIVSPDLLTGVDCQLPTTSGARPRVVGTVVSRAVVVGGQILQGSAFTRVTAGTSNRRLPWSHYLSQPGVVEAIGRIDQSDVIGGHLSPLDEQPTTLDLGAVSSQMMDLVQQRPGLDRRPALRAARTALRWVVESDEQQDPRVTFTVEDDTIRTLRLSVPAAETSAAIALCADLALHDWLLTTLLRELERSRIGVGQPVRAVASLAPAIRHLLHLWMPAARLTGATRELWAALDGRAGLSRQWRTSVDRIRDELALSTLTSPGAAAGPDLVAGNGVGRR